PDRRYSQSWKSSGAPPDLLPGSSAIGPADWHCDRPSENREPGSSASRVADVNSLERQRLASSDKGAQQPVAGFDRIGQKTDSSAGSVLANKSSGNSTALGLVPA